MLSQPLPRAEPSGLLSAASSSIHQCPALLPEPWPQTGLSPAVRTGSSPSGAEPGICGAELPSVPDPE